MARNTLSVIDFLILVGFSMKSVIGLRSLQTYTQRPYLSASNLVLVFLQLASLVVSCWLRLGYGFLSCGVGASSQVFLEAARVH